jgi:hypothetical protein
VNIPKGYKLVPVDVHVEKAFEVIDGKHLPTIKITLPACHPDDTSAWDRRDAIGLMVKTILSAAPTPPQPIYDEAKERELFEASTTSALGRDSDGYYIATDTYMRWQGWLACAQSRAKAWEVGHE